ncbi:uncharacterized protein STEHIDRAFT_164534 [Stereum hirsutum FP-91666 SS1]|uniref:uncharacterized protein n=1 Tax=Stereum hirsutum (strain FP-91666) TaxID=721885 RepID=UPI000440E423|nr:uncharacterized protein STEHIDRAFT_164534 [Stereum hirsutum FP-91666 SS1]EIM92204.1 hypothetical protein STEHIDRAFT_164534 [Stereum hirsutum FP-91666 SS1]
MNAPLVHGHDQPRKALPNPGADKLPPPPPGEHQNGYQPPAPPPKFHFDHQPQSPQLSLSPPLLDRSPSLDNLGRDLHALPPTPTSPSASSISGEARVKKSNPLIDLIETEKVYVDQLTGIIRKVASAWSRSNLPPPDLDIMFRSLEAIFKANRSLLARLKEIGTNPSSPKALGDLLMRWIDELEPPYTAYCERFCSGFDTWDPVRSNDRLPTMLASFSVVNPPPIPPTGPAHPSEPPIWTLDELFLIPKARLKYYRKLYGRLLKGTQPGRSDHRLLVGAADKLDKLVALVDSRAGIRPTRTLPPPIETEDEVVIGGSFRESHDGRGAALPPPPEPDFAHGSDSSSARGSNSSIPVRSSADTGNTSLHGRSEHGVLSIPISDLERRLSTDRCLDIFTMKPKQVKLQMDPPSLSFKREMRVSAETYIRFVPRSTGVEVSHPRGRIFILSDLFLTSELIPSHERNSDADMWLLYPPLAGKHLKVAAVDGQDNAVQVTIMRKEKLILEFESRQVRDRVMSEFLECIEFATAIAPSSKHPVPPLPNLNGLPKSPSAPLGPPREPPPSSSSTPDFHSSNSHSHSHSHSHSRSPPPPGGATSPVTSPLMSAFQNARISSSRDSDPVPRSGAGTPMSSRSGRDSSKLSSPPGGIGIGGGGGQEVMQRDGAQRSPSITMHESPAGPGYPRRTSSQAQHFQAGLPSHPGPGPGGPYPPPRGFGPGQVMPPGPGQVMPPGPGQSFGPGQIMQPAPRQMPGPGQIMPPGPGQFMPPGPGSFIPPQRAGSAGPLGGSRPPGPYQQQQQQQQQPFGNGRPPPQPGQGYHPGGGPGGPPNPPYASVPPRAPSDPSFQGGVRRVQSNHSLASQHQNQGGGGGGFNPNAPPMPPQQQPGQFPPRQESLPPLHAPQARALLPSTHMSTREVSMAAQSFDEPSPPGSPVFETPVHTGPVTTTVSAQMKCKVFLKQQHAQWKSLGSAKLKLFRQDPTNVKQLVVEAEDKNKSMLISTIVLADGVERVGKTGVAIELSDNGARTGIVYMIQLRNDKSAGGFFEMLIQGSDRSGR